MKYKIINSECLTALKKCPDNKIDALITDPPAGISFMGKVWDGDKGGRDQWIKWLQEIMVECLRVLKPGGHGLIWALPRTSHWTATALENAGFEIRDVITHHFGSGFPKSHNVGKKVESHKGYGTALKPATENWILIRKPFKGSVASNVLKYGTGGINIDGCRVGSDGGTEKGTFPKEKSKGIYGDGINGACEIKKLNAGRFPANLVLSHHPDCVGQEEEKISVHNAPKGTFAGGERDRGSEKIYRESSISTDKYECVDGCPIKELNEQSGVSGGASRFFYCAKPSSREKDAGLDELEKKQIAFNGKSNKSSKDIKPVEKRFTTSRRNTHPTVKSIKLMRYLIRLITPPNGIVLDPFMGSGTTGCACMLEGKKFIGIDQDEDFCKIALARIKYWRANGEGTNLSKM